MPKMPPLRQIESYHDPIAKLLELPAYKIRSEVSGWHKAKRRRTPKHKAGIYG